MPQIHEYNEMATTPASDDLLAIIDVSNGNELKKIKVSWLLGSSVKSFNGRIGAVTFTESDLTDIAVKSFNGRRNVVTLQSSDLNGLNGSGLVGIGTGTGGLINTGSTTIGADSDSDGVGAIALQTKTLTRLEVRSDGTIDFHNSPIVNFAAGGGALTPGSVLFADAGGLASDDPANFAYDLANHRLRVGPATADVARFHVVDSGGQYAALIETTQSYNDAIRQYGLRVAGVMTGDAAAPINVATNYAMFGQIVNAGSGYCGNLTAVRGSAAILTAARVQQMIGVGAACSANHGVTATVDPVNSFCSIGIDVDTFEISGGGTTNFIGGGIVAGVRILKPFVNGSGAVSGTSLVGLYIQDFYAAAGTWTNPPWGIFAGGGVQYLGGNVSMFNSNGGPNGFANDRNILFIGEVTAAPTQSYISGFALYSSAGHALIYRYATGDVPVATPGMPGTPTLSGFGTGKSVAAGSIGAFGEVDVGTSPGSTGTISFLNTWNAPPFVMLQNRTSNIPLTYTVTATAIVVTSSAPFNNNDKLVWIAKGSQ